MTTYHMSPTTSYTCGMLLMYSVQAVAHPTEACWHEHPTLVLHAVEMPELGPTLKSVCNRRLTPDDYDA